MIGKKLKRDYRHKGRKFLKGPRNGERIVCLLRQSFIILTSALFPHMEDTIEDKPLL